MTTPTPLLPAERTLRDLDVGTRIGFLVATALLALSAALCAWFFTGLQPVFAALLRGQSLPAVTKLAVNAGFLWMQLSAALMAVAAVVGLAVKRPLWALLTIAGCNLLLVVLIVFLATASVVPLVMVIKSMT